MKKFILLFLFISIGSLWAQDNKNLPNYLTEQEKSIYDAYIKNPPHAGTDDVNPPPGPVRTMAEWEECQGIIITWTSFQSILSQIVLYAQTEGRVFIVCSDSNTVKTYLQSQNVPLINLSFLIAPYNSIWCRDYGPWAVYSNQTDTLRMIDWVYNRPRPQDDLIPVVFANYIGVPYHQTINPPNKLIATGGNFMVDGNGTGFSSRLIVDENPTITEARIDSIMNAYMGINRYIKMQTLPYDGIHHIDMHIKLLDEETLLVGEYPPGVADGPQIELNLQYILNNFQTCYGRPYKVVRIVMPPGPQGTYPDQGGDYRTYTNSLIINKTVIIPLYEQRYDTTAIRIYQESMPGYRIVGINSNQIIPSLGTIHCITKEIGVNDPIFISHASLRDTSNSTQPYEVKAYIHSKSGIAGAKVFWSTDTTYGFSQVNMTAAADTFRAYIPALPVGARVYYYISANSNSGRTVTKPLPAPHSVYRFRITSPIGITGNNNSPYRFMLYQNYPNPFNPVTTIKFDIPAFISGKGLQPLVQIKLFDILGREVAVLLNKSLQPGSYEIKFDASNFSSGVYFYKLETESYNSIKKMILIK